MTLELAVVRVSGTPEELGRGYGSDARDAIRAFVRSRLAVARSFMHARMLDPDAYMRAGAASLAALRAFDAAGYDEHAATAAAAGVDQVELYAAGVWRGVAVVRASARRRRRLCMHAGNYTDLRDVATLRPTVDAEGCTAVAVPPCRSATGGTLAGQTWDLNPEDMAHGWLSALSASWHVCMCPMLNVFVYTCALCTRECVCVVMLCVCVCVCAHFAYVHAVCVARLCWGAH